MLPVDGAAKVVRKLLRCRTAILFELKEWGRGPPPYRLLQRRDTELWQPVSARVFSACDHNYERMPLRLRKSMQSYNLAYREDLVDHLLRNGMMTADRQSPGGGKHE